MGNNFENQTSSFDKLCDQVTSAGNDKGKPTRLNDAANPIPTAGTGESATGGARNTDQAANTNPDNLDKDLNKDRKRTYNGTTDPNAHALEMQNLFAQGKLPAAPPAYSQVEKLRTPSAVSTQIVISVLTMMVALSFWEQARTILEA